MERKIKILQYISTGFVAGEVRQLLTLVKNMDKTRFKIDVVCFEGAVADFLASYGIGNNEIGLKTVKFEGGNRFSTFLSLFRLIRNEKYGIVHIHPVSLGGIPARLAARLAGAKIVVSEDSVEYRHSWECRPFWSFFARDILHPIWNGMFLDRLIVPTGPIYDSAIKREKIAPAKAALIHYGIDIDDFQGKKKDSKELKRELSIEADTPVVGAISRLAPYKCLPDLIEAFAKVVVKLPDVKLLIAGIGPDRASLELQCKNLDLSGKVIFTGWSNKIADLINIMDIFVHPASYEEIGLATLEAMTNSKPVIITRTTWLARSIEDGRTGLLISPHDTEALADSISRLLIDRELSMRIGRSGHELVKEKFNSRIVTASTEKIYEELCVPE